MTNKCMCYWFGVVIILGCTCTICLYLFGYIEDGSFVLNFMQPPIRYQSPDLARTISAVHIGQEAVNTAVNETSPAVQTQFVFSKSDFHGSSNKRVSDHKWVIGPRGTSIATPGVYRACVPRPKGNVSMSEVITGGQVDTSSNMSVTRCLNSCIDLGYTYAALSRGIECFCSDVNGESALLNYTDSALCDMSCPGEPKYQCGGMEFMSLYRTSLPDLRCSVVELKPRGSLPLIALASYPRSGNSWTRDIIQRGTGYLTGSVYWSLGRRKRVTYEMYPGGNSDYHTKQTICVKSHRHKPSHIKTFDGAVLLVRNPYHSLVSEVFRRAAVRKKPTEEVVKYFDTPDWKRFAEKQSETWKNTVVQWITNSRRIHVAHYENLQENVYEELEKIVRFLDVPVQPQRILCAIQECPPIAKTTGYTSKMSTGNTQRVYLTNDPFPPYIRKIMDDNIKKVNETLLLHSLPTLPSDYNVEFF